MPPTVAKGTIAYLGKSTSGAGYVPPGQSRFRIYDSWKITGTDGKAKTFDTISILSTAEPEVRVASSGSFIVSDGVKVKVLVGIVKSDGVYNYTARAAADAKKAKMIGTLAVTMGVFMLIFPPAGIFMIWRSLPFLRFPAISNMTDAEFSALAI